MASLQMPLVIIAAAKLGSEAGFTLLAMKAAAIPMSLIGNSISQVYLSRAADAVRAGTLAELTLKIIIGLVGWGVAPLLCIGMLSPDLMPLVFGPKWTRAGEIMTWMIPWFIFQILSSPISMALHVTAQQSLAMVNQVWSMVLRVGLTSLATLYMGEYIVEIYCLAGILFCFGYFIIILRVSGVQLLSLLRSLKHQFLIVSWWVVLAIILKLWIGRFSLALVP